MSHFDISHLSSLSYARKLVVDDLTPLSIALILVVNLYKPITLYDRIINSYLPKVEALLEVVVHCHRLDVAHKNIKLDNFLFDLRSNLLWSYQLWVNIVVRWWKNMSGVVCMLYYVTSKILLGRDYNKNVDVWSHGVILYIMLVAKILASEFNQLWFITGCKIQN